MQKDSGSRASSWQGSWALLRDIEVVCAVIAERKTTGAALRLGVSQPSISRAIAKIEAKMGKQLFHRESGRLVPTADALALYRSSTAIFTAISALEDNTQPAERQNLRIIAPPTIGNLYLQKEAARFAREHPDVFVSFDILALQDISSAIAGSSGDVALIDSNVYHSGVILETFIETDAVCVMRRDHPLAQKGIIEISDLDTIDYVAIKRRHSLRHALDHIFRDNRVSPQFVIETDSAIGAIEFVQQGLGVSILNPFPAMLEAPSDLTCRPVASQIGFKTNFVISAGAELPAVVRQFVDYVKSKRAEVIARLAQAI